MDVSFKDESQIRAAKDAMTISRYRQVGPSMAAKTRPRAKALKASMWPRGDDLMICRAVCCWHVVAGGSGRQWVSRSLGNKEIRFWSPLWCSESIELIGYQPSSRLYRSATTGTAVSSDQEKHSRTH